ncbi:MAG TPA: AAA family ATPase [Puia sp.]|nr:AAA family ATPase [Puia sp.]
MDLLYYIRVVLKRKWIILFVAIVAGVVAWYFMRDEPKSYKSVTQISTGFTITDEIRLGENFSLYDADVKFNNAIATFTSPIVVNLLSYTLILHDLENPNPFKSLTAEKKKLPVYQAVNQDQARKDFADKLETVTIMSSFNPDEKKLVEFLGLYGYDYKSLNKSLNVNRLQGTDYIEIEFKSENPELSAFVVNTLFQQFLRYYNTTRGHRSQEGIDTLRSLMEKRKAELDVKNAALRGEAPVGQAADSRKLAELSNLERALTDEKSRQLNLYSSLRKVNQRLANMGVEAGSTPTQTATPPDNTNSEVLILRRAMNDAYMAYINSGSNDKNLLARYNQLKTEYQNKIINSNSNAYKTPEGGPKTEDPAIKKADLLQQKNDLDFDIQESNRYIDSLTIRVNGLRNGASRDASQEVATETLMKDADQANKDYLEAKKRYNDAIDYTSSSLNNFRQVTAGQPAIAPEPSKKILIVALAGIGSAVTAILIILVLAYLDSSVKTPRLFQRVVNLKLISMINFMNLKQKTLNELITSLDTTYDPKDKQRHNVFRESLRKLRYEIEKSGKKIFLFTSTKKGQGKTTIIQALAYSMSMSKKKILIIDTNFCNNDLTVAFEAPPILEKIVPNDRNDESLAEQIRNLSKDIGVETVFIIGSEGGDYTPSEILPRKHLLQHLRNLAHDYDYIFLEGPPLNDYSDSRELAQYVDGVIGIFSADQIIKQIDKESLEFFHELNGKFSGAILNKVDLEMVNVS